MLSSDTDSLIYEIENKDIYEDFSKDKEIFDFSSYSSKSKYDDDSNKLTVGKMRAETASVSIKELVVRVEPKMYSYLLDDSSEHKKAKAVNKNVAIAKSHNEYKDIFLNNKSS